MIILIGKWSPVIQLFHEVSILLHVQYTIVDFLAWLSCYTSCYVLCSEDEQDKLDYSHLLLIRFIFSFTWDVGKLLENIYTDMSLHAEVLCVPFTPLIANPYPLLPRGITTSLMLDCLGSREKEINCWTEPNNKIVWSALSHCAMYLWTRTFLNTAADNIAV